MTHSNVWVNQKSRIKSKKQNRKRTNKPRKRKKSANHSQRRVHNASTSTVQKGRQSTYTRQGAQSEFNISQVMDTLRAISNQIDLPKIKQHLSQVDSIVKQVDDVIGHIRQWRSPSPHEQTQHPPYPPYRSYGMMLPNVYDPRRKR